MRSKPPSASFPARSFWLPATGSPGSTLPRGTNSLRRTFPGARTGLSKNALSALVVWQAMRYFKAVKREDIIRDIHGLDAELAALEEQYGLLSADFYHFYRAGELEQTRDFIRWAGFYEAKQERETSYRQLIYEHLRELRRRSGLGALALDPAGA
jgi:hypothetical protein